jgi:hypothetical protein
MRRRNPFPRAGAAAPPPPGLARRERMTASPTRSVQLRAQGRLHARRAAVPGMADHDPVLARSQARRRAVAACPARAAMAPGALVDAPAFPERRRAARGLGAAGWALRRARSATAGARA